MIGRRMRPGKPRAMPCYGRPRSFAEIVEDEPSLRALRDRTAPRDWERDMARLERIGMGVVMGLALLAALYLLRTAP